MKTCLTDNQQPSLRDQGVQLLTRTKTVNRKSYGLYLCPKCNHEVELRIDTVNTHYKKYDYPKFCSACANKSAGENRIQHGDKVLLPSHQIDESLHIMKHAPCIMPTVAFGKSIAPFIRTERRLECTIFVFPAHQIVLFIENFG